MSDVVLLILAGGSRGSSLERMLAEARAAAVWDMVERALTVSSISRVVVATSFTSGDGWLGALSDIVSSA